MCSSASQKSSPFLLDSSLTGVGLSLFAHVNNNVTIQTTVISTTATRATRTPMTAPSAVLLILIVLLFCEVQVVGDKLSIVEVVVSDTLSVVVMSLSLAATVDYVTVDYVTVYSGGGC